MYHAWDDDCSKEYTNNGYSSISFENTSHVKDKIKSTSVRIRTIVRSALGIEFVRDDINKNLLRHQIIEDLFTSQV